MFRLFSEACVSAMVGLWLARRHSHFRKASRFSMVKSRYSTRWLIRLNVRPKPPLRLKSLTNSFISVKRLNATFGSSIRHSRCWRTGFSFRISLRRSGFLPSRPEKADRCVRGGFVPVRTWNSLRRYSRWLAARVLPKNRLSQSYFVPAVLQRLRIPIKRRILQLPNLSDERRTSIASRGSTALAGSLAANSMFGESRFANHVWFITWGGADTHVLLDLTALSIDLFGSWLRPKKMQRARDKNNHYSVKNEKFPLSVASGDALTWRLEAAIRDEKGLVSDVERDAAATCHGISSGWHRIVNRYPHIAPRASAHMKKTTKSQYANARSLANG